MMKGEGKWQEIGFIGLGNMGHPMVTNLLQAGFRVVVYDINPQAVAALTQKGASSASSARAIAERCPVFCTSLPGSPEVEQVYLGEEGLLAGAQSGAIGIDFSSVLPSTARKVAQACTAKGMHYLEAPVSGGVKGAREATLTLMVGGPAEILEQVRPVLEAIGKRIFRVGEVGQGNTVKAINNMLAAVNTMVMIEGMVLGAKAGLDPQLLYDVMRVSSGGSFVLDWVPQSIIPRRFAPGFTVALMHKDLETVISIGKDLHVPLTLAHLTQQYYEAGLAAGLGGQDLTALITLLERLVGVEVTSPLPTDKKEG
ncbi:MAG: NAD(P)-dependent oxidoreductase, partial [Nitrospinota bacterium]